MAQRYDPGRHQRRSIRLRGWDYRAAGYYFVTICTYGREWLFADGRFHDIALHAWHNIPTQPHAQGVELDEYCIMPNHTHGIVVQTQDFVFPVFDSGAPRLLAGSLGAVVGNYKSLVARRINNVRQARGSKVWQRGYYERIIRNERELKAVRQYIRDNPARWAEDRDNLDNLLAKMTLIL
ncbi:MAG: transposase [Ardenticatenaceae bacterium]|nr:transposase [Ardenticatenaceae bacterium]